MIPLSRGLRSWATMLAMGSVACGDRADGKESFAGGEVDARVIERATLGTIALDTLSDSARILSIIPEPDGDAVAFRFADPSRMIAGGLGLLDRARPAPQLGWPDSVTQVRWRGPHELVFTAGTGEGVRVIVNAHADTVASVEEAATTQGASQPPPATTSVPAEVRAHATRFIDSTRLQPAGQPQHSALRYEPSRILIAPRDSIAAFHVAGTDSTGRRSNPSWYILDLARGTVHPVDSIVGPVTVMPPDAGAWTDDGGFLYTKGLTLYEVRVHRERQ